jgi:hypothetical protein
MEGYPHSMNVASFFLQCLISQRISALFFLLSKYGPTHFGSSLLELSVHRLHSSTRSLASIVFSFTFFIPPGPRLNLVSLQVFYGFHSFRLPSSLWIQPLGGCMAPGFIMVHLPCWLWYRTFGVTCWLHPVRDEISQDMWFGGISFFLN